MTIMSLLSFFPYYYWDSTDDASIPVDIPKDANNRFAEYYQYASARISAITNVSCAFSRFQTAARTRRYMCMKTI